MKKVFAYADAHKQSNYAEALQSCGMEPVFSSDLKAARGCHGLLLCGGGDIEPYRYGQENKGSKNFEPERDEAEFHLVKRFMDAGLPILGICRGLQVLNTALGGALVQHLPTARAHAWEEETGDKQHLVQALPGSFLLKLYGERFPVNSAHHQGADKIPPALSLAAQAEDGVPEALQCPEKGIYAVQWHPERMMLSRRRTDTVDGTLVFRFFAGLL